MPRRGENIFKRQDGRWEARYIHHYENGKAKYRYLYGSTYHEVRSKRLAELTRLESEQMPMVQRNITLEQLARLWLNDIKFSVKESTYTRYHRSVHKYILPNLGNLPILKLDAQTVNRFSGMLLNAGGLNSRPLSSKSVCDILCVLKAIDQFGRLNGYPCPPLDAIRYPPKSNRPIKIFSPDIRVALETVLLCSEDTTSLGILFSLFTGVRIGELCGLRWGDIDLTNATVKICRTVERIEDLDPLSGKKTKVIISEPKTEHAVRLIPLPQFLCEYLRKQKRTEDIYLLSGQPSCIEPHCFYVRYKRFLRKHNIADHTFHSLRHTFATRCVEHGFDTKSLSEILGHANVTTTLMFYVHPSLEQKRTQMELLTPAHS